MDETTVSIEWFTGKEKISSIGRKARAQGGPTCTTMIPPANWIPLILRNPGVALKVISMAGVCTSMSTSAHQTWEWNEGGFHGYRFCGELLIRMPREQNEWRSPLSKIAFVYEWIIYCEGWRVEDVCVLMQTVLAKMQYAPWLKVHGKLKRPEMSKKQQLELKECFELIDSGGSGRCLSLLKIASIFQVSLGFLGQASVKTLNTLGSYASV